VSGSIIAAMIAGVILTGIAFAHPIGPGLMLVAESPFDAIPFTLFGVMGNLITYVPVIIFLIKVNPARWGAVFIGTRIQQLLAFFIVSLLAAHAMAIVDHGIGEIYEWLRKVTLFILTAIFAYSMSSMKHLALLLKVMVASMALFTFLSMLDFYVGIQLLPLKAGLLEGAALDTKYQSYMATTWRFTGAGFPVNRFSNYLLLVIFLGFGWFMYVKSMFQRLFAMGCVGVLILGELLTVTRSGIGGMVLGIIIMLPMAFRFRFQQVLGIGIIAGVLGLAFWYMLTLTSGADVLSTRFDPEHVVDSTGGRLMRIVAAFRIWADAPIFGVGWGSFSVHSVQYIPVGGKGAHNGYLNVLAETGLLGFIPLVIVLVTVTRRLLYSVRELSPELEFWRPYFFCGWVAQLFTNMFNDYLWERYLWLVFAFAVVLEQCYHAARARQARAQLEEMREEMGSHVGSLSPQLPAS
jgi:O-antigen ligase